MALSLSSNKGKNSSLMKTGTIDTGKKVSMGLLNFEWWMSDFIYKEKTTQTIATTTVPTTVKPIATTSISSPVSATTPAPASVKPTPAPTSPTTTTKTMQKEEKTTPQTTNSTLRNDNTGASITDAEKEQQYCFAVQMLSMHSYNIAYNALLKVKGYKNADELLEQIKDKV